MLSNLAMELTPLQNLSQDNLAGLILQMRRQMEAQAKRIEELETELTELRKKHPTQRLKEAYSVKAEEKRRKGPQQTGKPKEKKAEVQTTRANHNRREIGSGNSGRTCLACRAFAAGMHEAICANRMANH